MRLSSSKATATGSLTCGSAAASSTRKPGRILKLLTACSGDSAGKRGRSFSVTCGSAAGARRAKRSRSERGIVRRIDWDYEALHDGSHAPGVTSGVSGLLLCGVAGAGVSVEIQAGGGDATDVSGR